MKKNYLNLFIVFCLPVLLYLQTLTFGLIKFDDDRIINNHISFLKDFDNVPKAFLTDAFIDGSSKFYRPLQTLSYMTDIKLGGEDSPLMFHLTNILFLGLISCLIFLLLRKFLIPSWLSLLSSLIYCAHPLFVSNIAWIPARGDLQLMLFSLLSFLLLIEFLEKKKPIYLATHILAFLLAMFSKETAILLPFLFALYFFTYHSEKRIEKKYILNIALYAVSGVLWYLFRSKIINENNGSERVLDIFGQSESFGLTPVIRNLQTIPESLASFFIPVDIDIVPNFSIYKTLIGTGIIILIAVMFLKNKNRSVKEKMFCIFWFLLLLLPTMLYKHERIDYLQHRFFVPMTGILLFILFLIPEKWAKNGQIKNSWILIVAIIGLSSLTFIKARAYSDPMTFYNSAISQNSKSYFSYNNRGFIYYKQKSLDEAIDDFNNAIKLKPDYAQAYYNRGNCYFNKRLLSNALEDYSKAIYLKPEFIDAYNNRAAVYLNQGLFDKAIEDCTKAINIKPDYALGYFNRGNSYESMGLYEKACLDYRMSEKLGIDAAKQKINTFCK